MNTIFAKIAYELEEQHKLMLVTILSGSGSAPRGAGSMMLLAERGRLLGTIGGGALEKRAEETALKLLAAGCSRQQTYDLRDMTQQKTVQQDDRGENLGMACGGTVRIWYQYVDPEDPSWALLCEKVTAQIRECRQGQLVFHPDGTAPTLLGDDWSVICGGDMGHDDWSVSLTVHERAVIFGGGHCAYALEPLLRSVGFRVTVFDDRPEYVSRERFPQADQLICGDFDRIRDYLTPDAGDYMIVMTSGHSHDYAVERQVLSGPFAYLGVIGSRSKIRSVNARLLADGIPEEALAAIHTPIGISIKAVTPEEIAVSIAGELILCRAERRENAGTSEKACPMHQEGQ